MMDFYNPDRYPYWIYKQLDLVSGDPVASVIINVPDSADYLLHKIYIQYNSIGAAAPTTYSTIQMQIVDLCRSNKRFNVPTDIVLISTPGIYDQFPVARPANGQVFESMDLKRLFLKTGAFEIKFTNYINTAGDITLDVLCAGENILNRKLSRV